jgi:hypothetical protein
MEKLIKILFFVLLCNGANEVYACTCRTSPFLNERFEKAQNVFIGTVVETTEVYEMLGKKRERPVKKYKIEIGENIKGKMPPIAYAFYDNNEVCPDFPFHVGKNYLIYGHKKGKDNFVAYACGGSDFLEYVGPELTFIRRLARGEKFRAFFGQIERYNYDPETPDPPLKNVKIILERNNGENLEASTDDSGYFSFDRLPAGTYKIKLELPEKLWMPDGGTLELMESTKIVEINGFALTDGRISGRALNFDGTPLKNTRLNLWEIDRRISVPYTSAETDQNGNFLFYGLPEARFTISYLLPDAFLRHDQRSTTWHYLGNTQNVKESKIINLGFAEHRSDILFTLPPKPPQIRGVITDENGNDVEGASVFLLYKNSTGLFTKRIHDWKGEFSFPIYEEYDYEIYAEVTYGKYIGLKSEKIEISKSDIGKKIKLLIKTSNK